MKSCHAPCPDHRFPRWSGQSAFPGRPRTSVQVRRCTGRAGRRPAPPAAYASNSPGGRRRAVDAHPARWHARRMPATLPLVSRRHVDLGRLASSACSRSAALR
ncbi:putative leader peptide [Streptomyces sp. DT9]